MTKAMHLVRPAKKAKPRKPAVPAVTYPPGYFTRLIRQHNWPPGFVPSDAAPSTAEHSARAQATREQGKGWEAQPLNLPGAVEHMKRWKRGGSS